MYDFFNIYLKILVIFIIFKIIFKYKHNMSKRPPRQSVSIPNKHNFG